MRKAKAIYIGFDPRETDAFAVCAWSIRWFDRTIPIKGVVLDDLRRRGLYTRETREGFDREGRRALFDVLSATDTYDGMMSTEHANARFLVPFMARTGWALFCDCDTMWMANPEEVFRLGEESGKAVMVVKHDYEPQETVKMDGKAQTKYPWKNSSSMMLINCDHPAHRKLTLKAVNTLPGRDLHRLFWLDEEDIGVLPPEYNYLVGETNLPEGVKPKCVHFTRGLPSMAGYENCEYAAEWKAMLPKAVGAL